MRQIGEDRLNLRGLPAGCRLCPGQGPEHAPFLRFEQKHRQERDDCSILFERFTGTMPAVRLIVQQRSQVVVTRVSFRSSSTALSRTPVQLVDGERP